MEYTALVVDVSFEWWRYMAANPWSLGEFAVIRTIRPQGESAWLYQLDAAIGILEPTVMIVGYTVPRDDSADWARRQEADWNDLLHRWSDFPGYFVENAYRDGPRMTGRVSGRAYRRIHTLNWVLGGLAHAYGRRLKTQALKERR